MYHTLLVHIKILFPGKIYFGRQKSMITRKYSDWNMVCRPDSDKDESQSKVYHDHLREINRAKYLLYQEVNFLICANIIVLSH